MNIPCRTPLITAKSFSELLPRSELPFSPANVPIFGGPAAKQPHEDEYAIQEERCVGPVPSVPGPVVMGARRWRSVVCWLSSVLRRPLF